MSNRHASQIAGDKSGERSIVSSIIEEEEEDESATTTTNDDNVSYTIQEEENEGDDDDDAITNATNDDDLSETIYDENDHSTTYRSQYGTSLGPFSEDDETIDDDLLLFDSSAHSFNGHDNRRNNRHRHRSHRSDDDEDLDGQGDRDGNGMEGEGNSDDEVDGENEETQEEDDDDENSNDVDDDEEDVDAGDELNNRQITNNAAFLQEAENILQELLEQYDHDNDENSSRNSSRNNIISNEQYKEALLHLSTKWEQIYEQISYENEQQFLAVAQERNDLELEIDEMERRHRDELNIAKQEVMEQSQKIIMQEMKANADRERKSEGAIDKAVRDAIKETKEEMNEEFEIALGGMKAAQEEMQQRYEKLVADTKIRVRHEVREEADKEAEVKIHSFMENYEEMKNQVVELTMELEKRDMGISDISGSIEGSNINNNIDNSVVEAKDREIEQLKETLEERSKHMQELREAHRTEVATLETSVRQDKQLLAQKIAIFEEAQKSEYEEMVKTEVQKAIQSTKLELNQKFEQTLAGVKKSTQRDLEVKYKKLVRDAETKVRHDVQDEAKSEANHKISAFMENYEEMKVEIARMVKEKEQLKSNNANEIERMEMAVKIKSEEIGLLKDKLKSTVEEQQSEFDQEIHKIKSSHAKQVTTLKEQLNMKDNEVKTLQVELKNTNSIGEEKEHEIQLLKDSHENQLARLKTIIDKNEIELSQRDKEHEKSLALVSKNIRETVKGEYEEKIKVLELGQTKTREDMQGSYEEKIQCLQGEFKAEITSLQKSNEEMKVQLSEQRKKASSGHEDNINSLMTAHETQMHDLKASHMKEMTKIRAILDSVRGEKEILQDTYNNATIEFREAVQKMKEEHLSNVEKMKLKYKEAKTELQAELVKLKKENEILEKNRTSPKKYPQGEKRETIDSNTVEGLSISVRNSQDGDGDKFVLPEARTALSRSVKSGEDNKENSVASAEVDSLASALKSTSTPPRNKIDHSFQDLSPLTLGSPSPKGNRTARPRAATPITPPRVQKNTERTTRVRQTPDIPRSMARSSQRASTSTTVSKIRSPTRTRTASRHSISASSIPAPQAASRRTDPTKKKSLTRGGATSRTTSTTRSSSSSSISSTIKIVDRTPAKKSVLSRVPATNGIINSTRKTESNAYGETEDVRLLIINIPLSDKMKKVRNFTLNVHVDDFFILTVLTNIIVG